MNIKISNDYRFGFLHTTANFTPEVGDIYSDILTNAEALQFSLRESGLEASYTVNHGKVSVTLTSNNVEKVWGDGWRPSVQAVETQMAIITDHIYRTATPVRKANVWVADPEPDYDEQEE
jgi:hypothetical protein